MMHLKILTLNCWGIPIPGVCKFKRERLTAIAKELQKGEHDIVVLQEIWSEHDFLDLKRKLENVYSYSHYWKSGFTGSGVCIFSKHVILETFQHVYTLNGYADSVSHGDWFAGKLLGLAQVQAGEFNINVFGTHTHASYDATSYDHHRLVQSFELSEFVKLTSEACDAVIVAGDLNSDPDDLCYKLIVSNGNLKDAWLSVKGSKGQLHTSNCPDNSFHPRSRGGHCIDYVLFRNNMGVDMSCSKCELTMGRVPGEAYNYSDHEGVTAEFVLRKALTAPALHKQTDTLENDLSQGIKEFEAGERKVKKRHIYYAMKLLLACAALISLSLLSAGNAVLELLNNFFVLIIPGYVMYCFWMVIVSYKVELNSLHAVKADMLNVLKHSRDNL